MSAGATGARSLAAAALIAAGPSQAAELVAVPEGSGYCASITDGFCHEWTVVGDPRLRIVHYGFEDGADFFLYRRNAFGRYRLQLTFEPIVRVQGQDGSYFYSEYALPPVLVTPPTGTGFQLLASFDVPWEYAPNEGDGTPPWQRRKAAILFDATSMDPDDAAPAQAFTLYSVRELRKAASLPRQNCPRPANELEPLRPCP
ncbi:MAG: hypothetical protein ACREO3_04020 [Arenimonas sp.]